MDHGFRFYRSGCAAKPGSKLIRASAFFLLSLPFFSFVLFAHAILVSAVPGANQVVTGPDVAIKLRFNARIDAKRSRLAVAKADGGEIALPIAAQSAADTLAAEAAGLASGAYVLRWQVLASDGHISRGGVPFRVR
jgi:methionine-rich copper-binding protein CopC